MGNNRKILLPHSVVGVVVTGEVGSPLGNSGGDSSFFGHLLRIEDAILKRRKTHTNQFSHNTHSPTQPKGIYFLDALHM
jgi:hypothetical protein